MQEQWHLDKRVPVALIATLLGQMVVAIWWAASINQRVEAIERNVSAAAVRSQSVDVVLSSQSTQIAVLVERIEAQNDRVDGLTAQVAQTNDLLREYLRKNGGSE
jgi:acyl transferase domain-containing protein